MNWESLIAKKMLLHPVTRVCEIEDSRERNRNHVKRIREKKRYERLKQDPEFNKRRYEKQKFYRSTAEYKEKRAAYCREWRKNHIETEHERELHRIRNKKWNAKNRAKAA